MYYEQEEHDELEVVSCLYEKIKDMVQNGETVRLRPLAIHCDLTLADLKERQGQVGLIELMVRRELDRPDEN